MSGPERVRRLRWMCRRGMKELDVLLEAFLAENATALHNGSWPEFERFLDFEDDTLWDSVRAPGRAPDPAFGELIEAIRSAGAHRA